MPDPLAPLFEDLRRQALPRVQAPGAAAARRTVHRRVTVQAAALAAVVMAAGGTFIVSQRGGDGGTPAVAPSSMVSDFPVPASSAALWQGTDQAGIVHSLVPGAQHWDVMGEDTQDVGMQAGKGAHTLRVGCSGPAPLAVTMLLNDKLDQQHTIACTDSGVVHDFGFTMARAGSVRVLLGGGQFDAYALKVTKK
ncbi:hypothetical protein [Actinoplanes sp. NPDC049316]|uniref:hypothetical protein n=1 Tax=Actinoplanes sp. NPDC049316 TaxID=3154727 RepID=UPI00342A7ADE